VSLYRAADGTYRSSLLDTQRWLEHAFGTALASPAWHCRVLRQVHSANVHTPEEECPEGDGLVTGRAGDYVAVKTADCVPILLADPRTRAVAALHAGWRGTLAGIARRGVERMAAAFGSRPGDILSVIGPHIGPCCFEVGPEVSVLFRHILPERHDLGERTRLDLAEANRLALIEAGLQAGHISPLAPCTACAGTEFHSWRRDRQVGARMISAIGKRPE
jgi:YfiH family protein